MMNMMIVSLLARMCASDAVVLPCLVRKCPSGGHQLYYARY
jgi:hypothetical protein